MTTEIEAVIAAINAAGVPAKRGQRETGHYIIRPTSNLKPWAQWQYSRIVAIAGEHGFAVTDRMVDARWNEFLCPTDRGVRLLRVQPAECLT